MASPQLPAKYPQLPALLINQIETLMLGIHKMATGKTSLTQDPSKLFLDRKASFSRELYERTLKIAHITPCTITRFNSVHPPL